MSQKLYFFKPSFGLVNWMGLNMETSDADSPHCLMEGRKLSLRSLGVQNVAHSQCENAPNVVIIKRAPGPLRTPISVT